MDDLDLSVFVIILSGKCNLLIPFFELRYDFMADIQDGVDL